MNECPGHEDNLILDLATEVGARPPRRRCRSSCILALARQNPPAHDRRFGEALVYGADRSTWLSVRFDEYVPARPCGGKWLFSNTIGVHVRRARAGGSARAPWALRMLTEVGGDPRLLWGASFVDSEPGQWAEGAVTARSDRVARHVGVQYFFDRCAPGGQGKAPDFGLGPLPTPDPLRVLATDADTFTILP